MSAWHSGPPHDAGRDASYSSIDRQSLEEARRGNRDQRLGIIAATVIGAASLVVALAPFLWPSGSPPKSALPASRPAAWQAAGDLQAVYAGELIEIQPIPRLAPRAP